jgi:hypothetical protein
MHNVAFCILMLSVSILGVIMLSTMMLRVIMLGVTLSMLSKM